VNKCEQLRFIAADSESAQNGENSAVWPVITEFLGGSGTVYDGALRYWQHPSDIQLNMGNIAATKMSQKNL